jgi:DNA-binding MarR family transcriptional regulator
LILEIFRLHGRLIAAGDMLVANIGLTSARWQVLGAIASQPEAIPVVRIAQLMGLTRQSVQRIVDELAKARLVSFQPNPFHKRAKLVTLTAEGVALSDAALRLQQPWAASLETGLGPATLQIAFDTLVQLRGKLEAAAQRGNVS